MCLLLVCDLFGSCCWFDFRFWVCDRYRFGFTFWGLMVAYVNSVVALRCDCYMHCFRL